MSAAARSYPLLLKKEHAAQQISRHSCDSLQKEQRHHKLRYLRLLTAASLFQAVANLSHAQIPGLPGGTPACDPTRQSCAPSPSPSPSPAPNSCTPGPAGSTCGGSGPASQGNTSGTNTGAGNPINLITGNKYQMEVDMPALPGELGLEIIRHYNSANARVIGALGAGWRLSYESELYVIGLSIQVLQADGSRAIFSIDPANPSNCMGADIAQGKIEIKTAGSGQGQRKEYIWHWTHGQNAGRKLYFNAAGKLEQIVSASGAVLSITRGPAGELLQVTDPQGRSLRLSYATKEQVAQASTDRTGQSSNAYFAGIKTIDSPLGRFKYEHGSSNKQATSQAANLISVQLPTNVQAPAAHPWANRVQSSSSITKSYHYEDARWPQMLTGISINGQGSDGQLQSQRLSSYLYNTRGQAILSTKGTPAELALDANGKQLEPKRLKEGTGQEQVYLQIKEPALYNKAGTTILANSLGQITLYRHQIVGGEYRLLEARGAGCAQCGPTNIRYDYDSLGRMTAEYQLSPTLIKPEQIKASPSKTEQSKAEPSTEQILAQLPPAQILSSQRYGWDAKGAMQTAAATAANSKTNTKTSESNNAQPSIEYADARWPDKPTLISRASVVAGQSPGQSTSKRHEIKITYNAAGQITKAEESGWSPAIASAVSTAQSAQASTEATPISRTTQYTYKLINNKSVLIQIDGPLPNGPKNSPEDSDITTFEWDSKAHFVNATTTPGEFKTAISYDEAGRITKQSLLDGYRQIDTLTTYAGLGSIANTPEQITRQAWLLKAQSKDQDKDSLMAQTLMTAQHDAAGRRTRSSRADAPTEQLAYDSAGRPASLTQASGQQLHFAYTAEGQLLAQVLQNAQGKVLDGRMWLRNEQGQLLATLNPQGLERIYAYAPAPVGTTAISEKAAPANLQAPQNERSRRRLLDDFGRTVLDRHPEDGTLITRFEAGTGAQTGQEIQTQIQIGTDGKNQTTESLAFDHAGRLINRTREADKATAQASCAEKPSYQGPLLQTLQGCGNAQQFERNAFGQITAQTHSIDKVQYTQRFDYDTKGQLIARHTPQGQRLRYIHTASGTEQINQQRGWLTWLGSLTGYSTADKVANYLPASLAHTPVLAQAQRQERLAATHLAGLTHGNGSAQSWMAKTAEANAAASAAASKAATQSSTPQLQPVAFQVATANAAVPTPTHLREAPTRDSFGRQTTHTATSGANAGRQQTLVWNTAHQLAEVKDAQTGSLIARYGYDATGNRISKTVIQDNKEITQHFLYDNQHRLIAQADDKGSIQRQYLYTDHRAHSLIESKDGKKSSAQLLAIHTDWRGLPSKVLDKDQNTVWQQNFDAWGHVARDKDTAKDLKPNQPIADIESAQGAIKSGVNTLDMPLRLAGQQYDNETGLHYNIHRYYDPRHPQGGSAGGGRYISADPMGTPDGADRYAYVRGGPEMGIDPLGLFEVPTAAFLGNQSIFGPNSTLDVRDGGHGDILRIAFTQYNRENGTRFSQTMIDQIIRNNYHTDANTAGCFGGEGLGITGGGQCNANNHFDNPNDGAVYQVIDNPDGTKRLGDKYASYTDGKNDNWLMDGLNQIDTNRGRYSTVNGKNISAILGAFGQNSHALADFYAHSNWVDSNAYTEKAVKGKTEREYARGGFFKEKFLTQKDKCGWIPIGLNQSRIWDEAFDDVDMQNIFSGTVSTGTTYMCNNVFKGDIVCSTDKSTHGYWNKDDASTVGGKAEYSSDEVNQFNNQGKFVWEIRAYDGKPQTARVIDQVTKKPKTVTLQPGTDWYGELGQTQSQLKIGDRIYVKREISNRHQMTFYLAIEHSKQEIARLYAQASSTMIGGAAIPQQGALRVSDVFKMDSTELRDKGIKYTDLVSKQ